jgi:hypothetical protein
MPAASSSLCEQILDGEVTRAGSPPILRRFLWTSSVVLPAGWNKDEPRHTIRPFIVSFVCIFCESDSVWTVLAKCSVHHKNARFMKSISVFDVHWLVWWNKYCCPNRCFSFCSCIVCSWNYIQTETQKWKIMSVYLLNKSTAHVYWQLDLHVSATFRFRRPML